MHNNPYSVYYILFPHTKRWVKVDNWLANFGIHHNWWNIHQAIPEADGMWTFLLQYNSIDSPPIGYPFPYVTYGTYDTIPGSDGKHILRE